MQSDAPYINPTDFDYVVVIGGLLPHLRTAPAWTQVEDLAQQILATSKQLERIDIKATIMGVVHELSVYTVGGRCTS